MSWFTTTNQDLGLAAQHTLLKHFLKTEFEVKSTSSLNYVEFKVNNEPVGNEERILVLTHGYGSGLGFFFDNYDAFATGFDRIFAVDWRGMGLSNRSVKPIATHSMFNVFFAPNDDKDLELTRTTINEFIDCLEDFRITANVPRFVLAGHSLGGYLSARYALKYPNSVEALVLISPAGIEPQPPKEDTMDPSHLNWKLRTIHNLWKMNFTPQYVLRLMGPWGPGMVTSTINRRFASRWTGDDLRVISDYLYHISAAPGNGEYALNALLEPKFTGQQKPKSETGKPRVRVFAKDPLESDMCGLKMPVVMLFGDSDWLSYPTAEESIAMWRSCGVRADLIYIEKAGHHLYTDNSVDFNKAVVDWVRENAYQKNVNKSSSTDNEK